MTSYDKSHDIVTNNLEKNMHNTGVIHHIKKIILLPSLLIISVFLLNYFYHNYLISMYTFPYVKQFTVIEKIAYPLLIGGCLYWLSIRLLKQIKLFLQSNVMVQQHAIITILIPLMINVVKVIISLSLFNAVVSYLDIPDGIALSLEKLSSILIISALAWLLIKATAIAEKLILHHYTVETSGDLTARKMYTQMLILKRIAIGIISILAGCGILMLFENVRALGASVLTTAGVIGLVFTFAAQRSLTSLLSGLEIALTQPIKIGDAVMVENEFGTIEEINFRSVTVKLWDWRRLIVPTNYFLEKPFQNWSKEQSTNLIGTIYLYADYTLPLEKLREELKRILTHSKLWDGKVSTVQVSDAKLTAMEIRVLCSAKSPAQAWDLRCEVREKLIDFIVKNHSGSLPMSRSKQYKDVSDYAPKHKEKVVEA